MRIRRQGLISKSVYNTEESIVFMFSRQTDRYLPPRESYQSIVSSLTFDGLVFL